MDGWITIGTKLDSKQLQRDLIKTENELKKYDKQAQKLVEQEAKIKTKIEFDDQDYKKKIKDLNKRQQEEYAKNTKFGYVVNQEQIDLKYDRLREQLDIAQMKRGEQNNLRLEEIHQKMQENTKEQERLNNKIQETENLLNKAKGSFDLKGTIDNIGKSVQNVTKRVVRWGLAIFGVRSAYYFVRQAMSTLSQYDEQLATNLQYIRFVIASALEPLIKRIVEWAYKLLSIVGTLIKLLTGYDIFENSGVDKFQKGLSDSNKSAKQLKKTLAGFDEMNILNDNSESGGTNGGGINTPDIPLSSNVPLPKWMTDLMAYGNDIIAIIAGITGALIALKTFGLSPIQSIGIGIAITGIVYAIMSLLDYLKDPTWENFGGIIIGIGIAIAGIGIAITSLPVAIAGVAVAIVGIVIQNWEKIKNIFITAINWLNQKKDEIVKAFGPFAGLIVQGVIDMVSAIGGTLDLIFTNMKKILDNIINLVNNVFAGNWKAAWGNLVNIAKSSFYILIGFISGVISIIRGMFVTAFGVIGDIIGGIIKGTINAVLRYVELKINTAIGMFNSVLSFVNKISPVKIGKIGSVSLPRLAKGGIINLPGRGVPIGGTAIAGESGKEAVLPLQDTQVLQQIADAIGQRITINATIVNSMNGRVLNRELQKIQNQSSFATNGR